MRLFWLAAPLALSLSLGAWARPAAAEPKAAPRAKPEKALKAPARAAKPKKPAKAEDRKAPKADEAQEAPEAAPADDAKPAGEGEDQVRAAGTKQSSEAESAKGAVTSQEGPEGVKTYHFGAIEVESHLKSPQLIYFLRRVRAEFDAGALGHRSFLGELSDTRNDSAFR